MKLNIGDKVKFVNEKGGGIIAGIISSSKVRVAIEDGFEIPYQITDLIKIDNDVNPSAYFNSNNKQQSPEIKKEGENNNESNESHLLKQGYLLSAEVAGIYLGFVPANQKLIVSGRLDVFLINHTESEILFSIYTQNDNGDYEGKEYGIAESESRIFIDTIERENINDWEYCFLQILYYNYNNSKIISPASEEFKIKTQKLLYEENYKTSPFFVDEKAFVININLYSEQTVMFEQGDVGTTYAEQGATYAEQSATYAEQRVIQEPQEAVQNILKDTEEENKSIESFIRKHLKDEYTAEVDMHIWELSENHTVLSPNEIFRIQMNYFNKCLESALANKLSRVVFIHGVGNGTLKKEIRNKLEEEYPQIKVYDAPIAEYGIGATEITIPHNLI